MVELREAELLAHHMEGYLRALRGRIGVLSRRRHVAADRRDARARARARLAPRGRSAAVHRRRRGAAGATGPCGRDSERQLRPARQARRPASATPRRTARCGAPCSCPRGVVGAAGSASIACAPGSGTRAPSSKRCRVSTADGAIRFEFTIEGTFEDADIAEWATRGLTIERCAAGVAEAPGSSSGRRRRLSSRRHTPCASTCRGSTI